MEYILLYDLPHKDQLFWLARQPGTEHFLEFESFAPNEIWQCIKGAVAGGKLTLLKDLMQMVEVTDCGMESLAWKAVYCKQTEILQYLSDFDVEDKELLASPGARAQEELERIKDGFREVWDYFYNSVLVFPPSSPKAGKEAEKVQQKHDDIYRIQKEIEKEEREREKRRKKKRDKRIKYNQKQHK